MIVRKVVQAKRYVMIIDKQGCQVNSPISGFSAEGGSCVKQVIVGVGRVDRTEIRREH